MNTECKVSTLTSRDGWEPYGSAALRFLLIFDRHSVPPLGRWPNDHCVAFPVKFTGEPALLNPADGR